MQFYFILNDNEADERLLDVLVHYVQQKDMPIAAAKQILKGNLRDKSDFNEKCVKLNECIENKPLTIKK